jgi:hypothetical protein
VEFESDVLYQEPPEDGRSHIGYLRGSTPVLLSAPHAAVHTRQGETKEEEEFTAALVSLAAKQTGAHAIYARRASLTDPSWYAGVPYKRCLRRLAGRYGLCFVLDVHGTAPDRPFGVALGTMKGRSCPDQRDTIISTLEACGFRRGGAFVDRLDIDRAFTGAGQRYQETITRFVSEGLGIQAAQIELHPLLRVVERRQDATLPRPYRGDRERIERVVRALSCLAQSLVPGPAAHSIIDGST